MPGKAAPGQLDGPVDSRRAADPHDDYRKLPAKLQRLYEIGNVRTLLIVALRKDGALLGATNAHRQKVRPQT